jgi:hypothetical protein
LRILTSSAYAPRGISGSTEVWTLAKGNNGAGRADSRIATTSAAVRTKLTKNQHSAAFQFFPNNYTKDLKSSALPQRRRQIAILL